VSEPIELTPEQIDSVEFYLERWGRLTERRSDPIMMMLDGTEVAPIDISRAMRERDSRLYRHMLALIQAGMATGEELEAILVDFVITEEVR
jgi:hypothetical protein